MIKNGEDAGRSASKAHRAGSGWSGVHSWIFLLIVAVGLFVIGLQNRYHYLSPAGLGKAYRIDKLFGGIQEFDPAQGWITAENPSMPPPSRPMSMMEPPTMTPGSSAVPMNMPGMMTPPAVTRAEAKPELPMVEKQETSTSPTPALPQTTLKEEVQEEELKPADTPDTDTQPATVAKKEPPAELSEPERMQEFKKSFPDFGKDEFQLANDDLYPDWKKKFPDGTWSDFLKEYGGFVQWWIDKNSPPEAGFKLWNDYLTEKGKQ